MNVEPRVYEHVLRLNGERVQAAAEHLHVFGHRAGIVREREAPYLNGRVRHVSPGSDPLRAITGLRHDATEFVHHSDMPRRNLMEAEEERHDHPQCGERCRAAEADDLGDQVLVVCEVLEAVKITLAPRAEIVVFFGAAGRHLLGSYLVPLGQSLDDAANEDRRHDGDPEQDRKNYPEHFVSCLQSFWSALLD